MNLDEAIRHCMEKGCSNTECSKEHNQLAEWLKELKAMKGIKNGVVINGEVYEAFDGTSCSNCAFESEDVDCKNICEAFEETYAFLHCGFKKVNKDNKN